ncbi:type III secretion apparatus protein RspB [Pseudomonas rhodesiae]|jgi:CBS-domain-containing membrane protein|uniref:type III secretion apparatus protein RspB n=1 Tax=Pseudomonas rhodesiae TaxID=76760 RepID=UPI001F34E793|nr:type III secretion apparatus protein RspB [Pseudomonas rhodesiae]WLG40257.1 type III secretion apparatus protein RspB [Pseudomonas rhodesiae]
MLVEDTSPIVPTGHKSLVQSFDHSPSSSDLDFFASQLERPTSKSRVTVQLETMGVLTNAATAVDITKKNITRDLSRLSKNIDREALRKYPNDLSNAMLMSHFIVKSLGKTTQCIDKICNLQ